MHMRVEYQLTQMDLVVSEFAAAVEPGMIITLAGPLGAGKTTFAQRVCALLGVTGPVVSPTYAYLNVYEVGDLKIYHFDLYRISGIEEFESLGFAGYLNDPKGVVLLEWAERIISLLARPVYRNRVVPVELKYVEKNPDFREVSWGYCPVLAVPGKERFKK